MASSVPYAKIIGHEFLHQLKTNNPALYGAFKAVAGPLMTERGHLYATARMAEYKRAGRSQKVAHELGEEAA